MVVTVNGLCGRNARLSVGQVNKQDIESVTLLSRDVEVIHVIRNPQLLKSRHVLDIAIVSFRFDRSKLGIFFPFILCLPNSSNQGICTNGQGRQ